MNHLLRRLITGPPIDYLWISLLGYLPMAMAFMLDVGSDIPISPQSALAGVYGVGSVGQGYFTRPNWMLMPVMLPLGLWTLRYIVNTVCAVGEPGEEPHPVVQLVPDAARSWWSAKFSQIPFRASVIIGASVISLACLYVDLKEQRKVYQKLWVSERFSKSDLPKELDWSIFPALVTPSPKPHHTQLKGMLLLFAAYSCQFILSWFAFYILVVLFSHNRTYLNSIYRRSLISDPDKAPPGFVVLDFADSNTQCFGLMSLNRVFDAQIMYLVISGLVILISRFSNVSQLDVQSIGLLLDSLLSLKEFNWLAIKAFWSSIPFAALFPDDGQLLLAAGWCILLGVVLLPATLKFLPLLSPKIRLGGIEQFLLEFIPAASPGVSPVALSEADIKKLSSQFAQNSFWPVGDNYARMLFFAAFFVLCLILFPVAPQGAPFFLLLLYLLLLAAVSAAATKVLFETLRMILELFDKRLVCPAEDKP